ncbi:MAG: 4-alpha-glucanotransferase [Deltaproteobacteria bacterium]|jgi:4-alpha-glucanotransferase|nr:4-alpha-glucanotransferase [Deltaproteobacteria bacterium]
MSLFDQGWRAAALFTHITSLPSPYGVGDLGPCAHAFLDFLKRSGFHFWQVLPVNPTAPGLGNSPYSAYSAFAGFELLVSPDLMVKDGWLSPDQARDARLPNTGQVDFPKAMEVKTKLIDAAYSKVGFGILDRKDFAKFIYDNAAWLNDYAFFMAVKADFGGSSWSHWPDGLKYRDDRELAHHGRRLSEAILRIKFGQYLFFKQLGILKDQAKARGLGLIGDIAFYVNHDSSDVWSNRRLFKLNNDGSTSFMAGVPPDYYSETGQLWGNPVFDWASHQADGFGWWKSRIFHLLGLFDWVRLDHFRAFLAYWEVEPGSKTAATGAWQPSPGPALFESAASSHKSLNIIAEDLGVITPDVTALRRRFNFPGMRVLQFGFGSDQPLSSHTPFRIEPDNLVFSATHDNNTSKGWYEEELDADGQKRLSDIAGMEVTAQTAAWALIRFAYLSTGALSVVSIPDILNRGSKWRLNLPGTSTGNWGWRLESFDELTSELSDRLADLGAVSGRDNLMHPNILTY